MFDWGLLSMRLCCVSSSLEEKQYTAGRTKCIYPSATSYQTYCTYFPLSKGIIAEKSTIFVTETA